MRFGIFSLPVYLYVRQLYNRYFLRSTRYIMNDDASNDISKQCIINRYDIKMLQEQTLNAANLHTNALAD